MTQKLSPGTALMLTVPPLLWAGNAVVGRLVSDLVPPITLNFLRWLIAFFILLPLAVKLLKPASPLWPSWRRFAVLSLLGVRLLQRPSILGIANLYTAECDFGGRQYTRFHVGDWRCVFQDPRESCAVDRGGTVYRRCDGCFV